MTGTPTRRRASARPLTPLIALLLLGGCAAAPTDYRGLASAADLKPAADSETPFQYRDPAVDFGRYTRLMIDPATLYGGKDGQFGTMSEADRTLLADYLHDRFARVLKRRYRIVTAPGPDTARLHLTLTGAAASVPVLSTLSHLAPAGLVINTGLEIAGRNGTFFGSVSYAVELSDSESGQMLYAYVTRQTPDALDITASFGYLDAARTGIRIGADHFLHDLQTLGMAAHTASNAARPVVQQVKAPAAPTVQAEAQP